MPTPYSYDLRAKVLQAIDEGMTKTQASQVFRLSRNTINLWLKRREETGDCKAKVGYQKGYRPKIADLEKFKEFARQHGRKTQAEMAQAWNEDISARTIGSCLKKIGFTRKKKLMDTEKEMKKKDDNFFKTYKNRSQKT
jgi:transposase